MGLPEYMLLAQEALGNSDRKDAQLTHPSKVKGNVFERELVNQAKEFGLESERAYASNGKALGHSEEVDLVVDGVRVQAKRRKSLASYLQIPDGADVVAFRQDRGDTLVLMRYEYFLELVRDSRELRMIDQLTEGVIS